MYNFKNKQQLRIFTDSKSTLKEDQRGYFKTRLSPQMPNFYKKDSTKTHDNYLSMIIMR